jgi:ferredoxin
MNSTLTNKSPQAAAEFAANPEFAEVPREVCVTPPRYRNEIGKFSIHRASNCVSCGKCVELCRYGVHTRPAGYRQVIRPLDYRCVGHQCEASDAFCVKNCPAQALSFDESPVFKTLGDHRWTPDLLASNWWMAETGHKPPTYLESEIGRSGGGFDRLRFVFPDKIPSGLRREDIVTTLQLDRRPLVRRRHVVRVNEHQGAARQGAGGQGLEYLQLHR